MQWAKGTAYHPAYPWITWTRWFFDLQTQYFVYIASLELSQADINVEKMQRFCYLFLDSIIKDFRSTQIVETGTHYPFQLLAQLRSQYLGRSFFAKHTSASQIPNTWQVSLIIQSKPQVAG